MSCYEHSINSHIDFVAVVVVVIIRRRDNLYNGWFKQHSISRWQKQNEKKQDLEPTCMLCYVYVILPTLISTDDWNRKILEIFHNSFDFNWTCMLYTLLYSLYCVLRCLWVLGEQRFSIHVLTAHMWWRKNARKKLTKINIFITQIKWMIKITRKKKRNKNDNFLEWAEKRENTSLNKLQPNRVRKYLCDYYWQILIDFQKLFPFFFVAGKKFFSFFSSSCFLLFSLCSQMFGCTSYWVWIEHVKCFKYHVCNSDFLSKHRTFEKVFCQ